MRGVKEAGYSLIELMVSIVIGLLLTSAIVGLFISTSNSNSELVKTNSQIENGRFTLQILENDLVHAGFWDTYIPQFDNLTYVSTPGDVPNAVPNPCLSYLTPWNAAYLTNIIGINVQTYADTPPSGSGCVTNFATNKKANTDVLVVRHLETCLTGDTGCDVNTTGKLYFESSMNYNGYCQFPLVTDVLPYTFGIAGFGVLHKRDCITPVTNKRKFVSNIYYIRNYSKIIGDGIPTLMMSTFDLVGGFLAYQSSVELIDGVEGFNVELGVDSLSSAGSPVDYTQPTNWPDPNILKSPTNRGDGVPDGNFVHCTDALPCTFSQLTNVVAVKLYVLTRAEKSSPGYVDNKVYTMGSTTLGPFNDGYKRHVFSTSVRLHNISGRRETPL